MRDWEINEEVEKLKDLGVCNVGVLQRLTSEDWSDSGCSERAVAALRNAMDSTKHSAISQYTLNKPLLNRRTASMERSVSRPLSLQRDFA